MLIKTISSYVLFFAKFIHTFKGTQIFDIIHARSLIRNDEYECAILPKGQANIFLILSWKT